MSIFKIIFVVPERACLVERLFLCSLITIVSLKSTRRLQVYHSIKDNEICNHTYPTAIMAVRMNRKVSFFKKKKKFTF